MIAIFPEIAACSASGDLERLGILVRNYFGEDQKFAPNLNMSQIMKNVGIDVQRLPLDGRAALLAKDEKGVFQIFSVLTEGLSPEEEKFILAHQLGHFLMHVQPLIARGDWNVSGYKEAVCPMKRYGQGEDGIKISLEDQEAESLADNFAAAALMPKAMIKRAMEKVQSEEKVAKFFGLPQTVIRRRLQQIGMAAANQPANFIEAAQQIGQPLDSKLAVEAMENTPQLKAPSASSMPKSLAANSYGKTDSRTAVIHKSKETSSGRPKGPKLLKGMERIRELARQVDKGL